MKICAFIPVACLLALAACKPSTDQDRGGPDAGGQTAKPLTTGGAGDGKRVALVIGCENYGSANALKNPKNDAALVSGKLKELKFDTVLNYTDLNAQNFVRKLAEFKAAAAGADVAVFYFAGHGMEVEDVNYMLPTDAVLEEAADLAREAISLPDVLKLLTDAQVKAKVIILDCCRNNPFANAPKERAWMRERAFNTSGQEQAGLAHVKGDLPQGTVIMLAAAPGKKAKDGPMGGNSPFATALAATLGLTQKDGSTPENVFETMMSIAEAVTQRTGGQQEPWLKFDGQPQLLRRLAFAPVSLGRRERVPSPPPIEPTAPSELDSGAVGKVIQFKLPGEEVMKFCYCPAGSFTMGSPEAEEARGGDEHQVNVRISKGFWMAQTPCTQGQWSAVMGSNPSNFTGNSDLPVECVRWEEVTNYCEKLKGLMSLPAEWKIALPTEAQWEYACRAGTEGAFHFGNVLNGKQANCNGDYPYGTSVKGPNLGKTSRVASYPANAWGLCDMHGNVWQWCADWYWEKLRGGIDPAGPATGAFRVIRGGSYSSDAALCRAAYRNRYDPSDRNVNLGFRPALVPSR